MYRYNSDLEEELLLRKPERQEVVEMEVSAYPCMRNNYFDCNGCGDCMMEDEMETL